MNMPKEAYLGRLHLCEEKRTTGKYSNYKVKVKVLENNVFSRVKIVHRTHTADIHYPQVLFIWHRIKKNDIIAQNIAQQTIT